MHWCLLAAVTSNGEDYCRHSQLLFEYVFMPGSYVSPLSGMPYPLRQAASMYSHFPAYPTLADFRFVTRAGPIKGGTMLSIYGVGVSSSPLYRSLCTFHDIVAVPVHTRAGAVVVCTSPPWNEAQHVHVNLQIGNSTLRTPMAFQYIDIPDIVMYPPFGPTLGGTRLVLHARGHIAHQRWWCRFHSTLVPAERLTGSRLQVRLRTCPMLKRGPAYELLNGFSDKIE